MMFCYEGQKRLTKYLQTGKESDKVAFERHKDECPFCQTYRQELYEASKTAVHPPYVEEEA